MAYLGTCRWDSVANHAPEPWFQPQQMTPILDSTKKRQPDNPFPTRRVSTHGGPSNDGRLQAGVARGKLATLKRVHSRHGPGICLNLQKATWHLSLRLVDRLSVYCWIHLLQMGILNGT